MAPLPIVQDKVAYRNTEKIKKSSQGANPMLGLLGSKPKASKNEDIKKAMLPHKEELDEKESVDVLVPEEEDKD